MASIKNISIERNNIDERLFMNNGELKWIMLNDNDIEFISSETFNKINDWKFLNLQSNSCLNEVYYENLSNALATDAMSVVMRTEIEGWNADTRFWRKQSKYKLNKSEMDGKL